MRLDEVFLNERYNDIADELWQYRLKEAYFVTYVDIPKLGINPKSAFNTPIGIYAYPLREIYSYIQHDEIPFGEDRPYVILFQASGNIIDLYTDYNDARLKSDLKRLYDRFAPELYKAPQKEYDEVAQEEFGKTWGQLTPEEQKATYLPPLPSMDEFWKAHIDRWIHDGSERQHYPGGKLWNITYELALHFYADREMSKPNRGAKMSRRDHRTSVIWNSIFRFLGYDGFTDRKGIGLIHGAEPVQAVFFSTAPLRMLKILPNVRKTKRPSAS